MKKIRFLVNTLLGSLVAAIGLTSCGTPPEVEYGGPYVEDKYGVPFEEWEESPVLPDDSISTVETEAEGLPEVNNNEEQKPL